MAVRQLEVVLTLASKRLVVIDCADGTYTVLEVVDRLLPYRGSSVKVEAGDLVEGNHIRIHTQQTATPTAATVVKVGLSFHQAYAAMGQGLKIHDCEP